MHRTKTLLACAAIALGISGPANADYVRLGSVEVGYHTDLDRAYTRFGGGLVGLRFIAGRSDIWCRDITVHFMNGDRQTVFSGHMDEHMPIYADLRGGVRRVDHINFHCHAEGYSGKIYIEGDVGRFRDEWRHDHSWDSIFGSAGPGPGPGPEPGYGGDWVSLGVLSFEGRHDAEAPFAGWRGTAAKRLGLRPLDADAVCTRIHVSFYDGPGADLDWDKSPIAQGSTKVIDLPGYRRNVRQLLLRCHALGEHSTRVEVLVMK